MSSTATVIDGMPANASEATFMDAIIKYAIARGWQVVHFRHALTARGYRTAIEGMTGFPDLILARDGVVICAELKSHTGRASPAQRIWLRHLGAFGRLWKPADWATIKKELA